MDGKGGSNGWLGKTSSLIFKLFLFGIYIYFQTIFYMLSPMLTDAGVPELSISNTPSGLFAGMLIMSPSIIAALVVWRIGRHPKLKKALLIFLSIIIIIGIDLLQPMVGAHSVSGFISNRRYEKKVSFVIENHPKKDPDNLKINTSYGSYFYDTNNKDVLSVLSDRIVILDKELDSGSGEVLYYLDMGDGIIIEVLQQHESHHQSPVQLPLMFKVSGEEYIYSIDNSLLFQGEGDAPLAYLDPFVELVKDGSVISICSLNEPAQGLDIDLERFGLVFVKDGEEVLRRSFDDGSKPFDISELDFLMDEGEWSVTLYTYVSNLGAYYDISNSVYWN